MIYSEAIRFSLQSLKANRLRTFLTALGFIIGNAAVILVVTISLTGKDLILDLIRGVGSNLISATYETGGQNTAKVEADFIKLADLEAIRQQLGPLIVAATGILPYTDRIVVNGYVRDVGILGTDEHYATVRNLVVVAGRRFDKSDITLRERVAMLTDKLANRLFGSQEAAIGKVVKISQLQFTVIGTFREKTTTFGLSEMGDETILIPSSVARYFVQLERVDPLYVQTRNAEDVPRITSMVRQIIESRHRAGARYTVQNLKAILDMASTIVLILTIILFIVSAIALLISGIGIMNIMLVTVTERTREIGLRMAVGASKKEIMGQFLTESVIISLAGGLIGILIGISIPLIAQQFSPFPVPLSPWSIVVAFLVSFAVGIGFGLLPARRASKLNPTEALRYE